MAIAASAGNAVRKEEREGGPAERTISAAEEAGREMVVVVVEADLVGVEVEHLAAVVLVDQVVVVGENQVVDVGEDQEVVVVGEDQEVVVVGENQEVVVVGEDQEVVVVGEDQVAVGVEETVDRTEGQAAVGAGERKQVAAGLEAKVAGVEVALVEEGVG